MVWSFFRFHTTKKWTDKRYVYFHCYIRLGRLFLIRSHLQYHAPFTGTEATVLAKSVFQYRQECKPLNIHQQSHVSCCLMLGWPGRFGVQLKITVLFWRWVWIIICLEWGALHSVLTVWWVRVSLSHWISVLGMEGCQRNPSPLLIIYGTTLKYNPPNLIAPFLAISIFPWQVTCISTAGECFSCADASDLPREDEDGHVQQLVKCIHARSIPFSGMMSRVQIIFASEYC